MKLKYRKIVPLFLVFAVVLTIGIKLAYKRNPEVRKSDSNNIPSVRSFVTTTNTPSLDFIPQKEIKRNVEYHPDSGGATAIEIDHGLVKLDKAWQESAELQRAKKKGASGKVTLHIIDTQGVSISEAEVFGGFYTWAEDNPPVKGKTDNEGTISFEQTCTGDFNFSVSKDRYYTTTLRYWFYKRGFDCVQDGRWLPWNPTLEVVLKEKRKPIAMATKIEDITLPVKDERIGFDCEVGDWLPPYGRGNVTDLAFTYSFQAPETPEDQRIAKLTIESTSPEDGFILLKKDKWSELPSIYEAPENGYFPKIELVTRRIGFNTLENIELTSEDYLVIRSRTRKDTSGRIIQAHYSKVYGPLMYGGSPKNKDGGEVRINYYFNKTPNDRNLESDSRYP